MKVVCELIIYLKGKDLVTIVLPEVILHLPITHIHVSSSIRVREEQPFNNTEMTQKVLKNMLRKLLETCLAISKKKKNLFRFSKIQLHILV